MLDVMGTVYHSLGLYAQAKALLARAVEIRRRVLGRVEPLHRAAELELVRAARVGEIVLEFEPVRPLDAAGRRAPRHAREVEDLRVEREPRVCFEVDEAGPVFDYGRFECDSSVSYRSVIAFGTMRIVDDVLEKQAFLEALMEKYGTRGRDRPRIPRPTMSPTNGR